MEKAPRNKIEKKEETKNIDSYQERVSELKELIKEIPTDLNVAPIDRNKFKLNSVKYEDLIDEIGARENKQELINYFINKVGLILEKRKYGQWQIPEGLSKEETKNIKTEIKELTEARLNKNFLGEGRVGCIYQTKYDNTVCLKFLKPENDKQMRTLHEEYFLHKSLTENSLKNKYLKIPYAIHLVKNIKMELSFFSMQRIYGDNFRDIFEEPEILSEKFSLEDLKEISEKLNSEDFINGVSKEFRNIRKDNNFIYSDVHTGNIMLDENKELFLIDYGNVTVTYGQSLEGIPITEKENESFDNIEDDNLDVLINSIKKMARTIDQILENNR